MTEGGSGGGYPFDYGPGTGVAAFWKRGSESGETYFESEPPGLVIYPNKEKRKGDDKPNFYLFMRGDFYSRILGVIDVEKERFPIRNNTEDPL